ncbi:MAG TPA: LysR family transcriptional regulator [Brachybacterium massiliense]|uniref:LysR family transcriptional regulator n=1 Tax=Brachybacterium massiliense TaxID=1755098 RepID=A0A921MTJ6_9MICO|nr:LysR family transcriptional regulator [Brachybacterium massiliense]
MLDPVKLRVLRSVVETESIRASAEALGYTPSAVSQHLSVLGRETGVVLLERTGRGISVTSAARLLAEQAGTALDALASVDRLARELASGRTGSLTFGYMTSVAATWVPVLARDVRRAFPQLSLDLLYRDCSVQETGSRADVVLTDDVTPSFGADWREVDLLEEIYSALVAVTHPLADREEISLTELAELPWVTDDPLDSWWFDRIAASCRAAGFTPPVEVNPSDYPAVTGFVATGDYVSVQPSLIAAETRPDIVAIPLSAPAPTRRVQMRVRRAAETNPAALFLMERIRAITVETAERIPGVTAL